MGSLAEDGRKGPSFVVSLDFELMWGVRDHLTKEEYGRNVLGVRQAIPRMLELFAKYGIRATWATVGFLFCESKSELFDVLPSKLPEFKNSWMSNYGYLSEIGENETDDPYYFGLSLLRMIQSCAGQEIGTHTFSHLTCLEAGVTNEDFRNDLKSALNIAKRRGIVLKSVVFPRNQYDGDKIKICSEAGFKTYRGNESHWLYKPTVGKSQNVVRRGLRLTDHYLNVSGPNVSKIAAANGDIINVPSSRFLRPYSKRLRIGDNSRLRRITTSMDEAAKSGSTFHVWWHPHNFGRNLEENIAFLENLLLHYRMLNQSYGMRSFDMGDFGGLAA